MGNSRAACGVLIAALLLVAAGCSSTPAEPGTVDWQPLKGTLVGVVAGEFPVVMKATMDAMTKLGLSPMRRDSDAFSAFIVGSIIVGAIPQERELTVTLTKLTPTTTEIALHIVFTRERDKLDLILAEIEKRLAAREKKAAADKPAEATKPAEAAKPAGAT
jgi:hypothetical protein